MDDLSKLCFSCFRPLDENGRCPHCDAAQSAVQAASLTDDSPVLPLGTMINNRYFIGKAIKTNGEGSTYVAYDNVLDRPCSVREFYPSAIAARDFDGITVLPSDGSYSAFHMCYDAFLKLWTKLMRLKGLTALISVYDVFKANGTVYAVYSDSEETTLRTFLLGNGAGYIPWEQARILFMPVLSTLSTLHTSGIVHRGIDPSALIVTPDSKLKLTDFCTANVKTAYGELESDISDGYAPLEVYSKTGDTGSWTDIYSFTAVLFRALVGSTPIAAPIRAQNDRMMIPAKFAEQLPPYVINAIINGMQLDIKDRTHNAEQLRSNLSASPRAIGASATVFAGNTAALNAQTAQQRIQQRAVQTAARPANSASGASGGQPEKQPYEERLTPERVQRAKMAEEAAEKKTRNSKLLKIFGIVILIMLLVGAGLVITDIINSSGSHGEEPSQTQTTQAETVVIPQFTDKMYDAVISDTFYSAMLTFKMNPVYDAAVERGKIISQNFPVNSIVAKGTCVTLTVSMGPENFALPDVTGLTYEQAQATLAARGLVCKRNVKYNDGTHRSDTVAETVPPVNSQVTAGDEVSIVMWSNADDDTTAPGETAAAVTAAPAP